MRQQKRAASAALWCERNSFLFRNRRGRRAVDAESEAVDQSVDEGMRGCDRVVFASTRHGVRVRCRNWNQTSDDKVVFLFDLHTCLRAITNQIRMRVARRKHQCHRAQKESFFHNVNRLFAQLRPIFQAVGSPFDEFLNSRAPRIYFAGFVRFKRQLRWMAHRCAGWSLLPRKLRVKRWVCENVGLAVLAIKQPLMSMFRCSTRAKREGLKHSRAHHH